MRINQIFENTRDDIIANLKAEFVRLTLTLAAKRHPSISDRNTIAIIRQGINDLIADPTQLEQLRAQWTAERVKHHHPGLFKSKAAYRQWNDYHSGKSIGYTWLLDYTRKNKQ